MFQALAPPDPRGHFQPQFRSPEPAAPSCGAHPKAARLGPSSRWEVGEFAPARVRPQSAHGAIRGSWETAKNSFNRFGHESSPFPEKGFVRSDIEQVILRVDALCFERAGARLLDQSREILARCLVVDLSIGLATDEGQIRNVVGLARRITAFQNRLRKDVVKLESVLSAPVSQ